MLHGYNCRKTWPVVSGMLIKMRVQVSPIGSGTVLFAKREGKLISKTTAEHTYILAETLDTAEASYQKYLNGTAYRVKCPDTEFELTRSLLFKPSCDKQTLGLLCFRLSTLGIYDMMVVMLKSHCSSSNRRRKVTVMVYDPSCFLLVE